MFLKISELIEKYNIKCHGVLHIGAHLCEEINRYHKHLKLNNSQIIWVEANPDLVKKISKIDKTIIVKNFICCDKDTGTTKLNIANNGQSSSILKFGTHEKLYSNIKYTGYVSVKNNRIDNMYKTEKIPNNFANFLNLDIQGAELLALKGMGNLINDFDYIYTEVNSDYVYKNCALVHEIDDYLKKYNFIRVETYWVTKNGESQGWGDAFYIKKNN